MTAATMTPIPQEWAEYYDVHTVEELPALNAELLFSVLAWARQDQEYIDRWEHWGRWDQGAWGRIDQYALSDVGLDFGDEADVAYAVRNGVCGTAMCIAGQAVVQSGYRM